MLQDVTQKTPNPQNPPQNSKAQTQAASFFCLRSSDNGWQFLGMDTGYNDHVINIEAFLKEHFEDIAAMPDLPPNEIDWHEDKLKNFVGRTVLLSHHQLYSNNSPIGSPVGNQSVNTALFKKFCPFFPKVAAWFWGHEHGLAVFNEGTNAKRGFLINPDGAAVLPDQLKMGRCVGHSAIPVDSVSILENPYKNNYPGIPFMPDPTDATQPAYLLGIGDSPWYNHGFEILQLNGAGNPITVMYYEVLPDTGLPSQVGPAETIS